MSSRVTNGSRDLILNRRWNTPSKCAQPRRAELHASRKASIKMKRSSSPCILRRAPNERQVNNFQSHFTLSNLCTLPLALNGPTLALKRKAHMLACHTQCRHTETVIAKSHGPSAKRHQRECRSHQINKKNGRHHAQHRCYLGWTSQRMDHLKRVAH
jgi:hypothetical protein